METDTPSASDQPPSTPRTPPEKPSTPTHIHRFRIGANVLAQVVFFAVIVLLVNFISTRHFKRWDLSRNQKYALSPQTIQLLRSLDKPVKAIVFFNQNVPVANDVGLLLREYEFASKKFEKEVVDPYNNLLRAKELSVQYKFGDSDNIVILDYNGRTKFVNARDMAEFDQMDQFAAMSGQPPRIRAFKGEQAITSALLEITEEKQNKALLVAGHGEQSLEGRNLEAFKAYCQRQNVKLEPIRLSGVDSVPADASCLVIIGPRSDFSERELSILSDYWKKNGRLFILLDPEARTPRLDSFLSDNGAAPNHDRVLRTGTGLTRDESQQIGVRTVVVSSPTGTFSERGREIAKDLVGVETQLLGSTQSIRLEPQTAQALNIRLTPLLESSKEFWGETQLSKNPAEIPFFDPQHDNQGPLVLAAALEKGAVADQRVKVDTARLILAGNAAWLTDQGLRTSDVGIDFAVNALNWLLNREELIGIAPKEKKPVRLDLSEPTLNSIAFAVIVLIPGLVALCGFGTWLSRRS